jgi:hypothetical protein
MTLLTPETLLQLEGQIPSRIPSVREGAPAFR